MGFLHRFLPPLPVVDADATTREAIESRVLACRGGAVSGVAAALVAVRDLDLWPVSEGWRARCGVSDAELGCELLLLAVIAAHLAGLEDVGPLQDALIQSVAFAQRERFADGPGPVLKLARQLATDDQDLGPVVVSLTGHRLGLPDRRGGSDGWFLLGTLAWIAGETAAEACA